MRRFKERSVCDVDGDLFSTGLTEDNQGGWVKWGEAQVKITKLEKDRERLAGEVERLSDAGKYLLHFIPEWAKEVKKGLCPTMYGTGSYEKDLVVKDAVEKATEAITTHLTDKV